jgi:hypothetical protein
LICEFARKRRTVKKNKWVRRNEGKSTRVLSAETDITTRGTLLILMEKWKGVLLMVKKYHNFSRPVNVKKALRLFTEDNKLAPHLALLPQGERMDKKTLRPPQLFF